MQINYIERCKPFRLPSYLPARSFLSVFLSFLGAVFASIYYFLTVYFVDVLGMNASLAGFVIAAYGLGTIVGGYLGGYFSDLTKPMIVCGVGLLGQSVTIAMLVWLVNPLFISMDLFCLGVSSYCFITSNYVSALSYCDNEETRLKVINMLSVASNLGIGVAALLISELSAYGYTKIFCLSGCFLFILSFILFLNKRGANNSEVLPNLSESISEPRVESSKVGNAGIGLILLCLLLTGMVVSQSGTTYSIYLKESFPSLGVRAFGFYFALNTILIILFQNRLVARFSRSNKVIMIGVGSFLIGAGMFVFGLQASIVFIVASCFIYSVGEMIFFSMVQLYCYQASKAKKRGRGLGVYRMTYALSRFLGPAAGGSIYSYLGGHVLWDVGGAIGVIFLLVFFSLKGSVYE